MAITKQDVKQLQKEILKHQLLVNAQNGTYIIRYYKDFIKLDYIYKGVETEITHKGITDEPIKIEEVSAFDFIRKQKLTVDKFIDDILQKLSKLK